MRAVLLSALARGFSLLPNALSTLLASRLILDHYGIGAFDGFALVMSLMAMIPLNDLGVGSAITAALGEYGPRSPQVRRVLLTASRVLAVSSAVLLVVCFVLTVFGLWPTLLGPAAGANLFCGIAIALYAVTFVPGLGQSVLLGLNRNHVAVWVQASWYPLTCVLVAAVVLAGGGGGWVALAPPVALLVVNLVTAVAAGRSAQLSGRSIVMDVPRRTSAPGVSIRAMAGPMLIVSLAVPLALQSDRIVLSHVTSRAAVANYSVAIQLFAPILALVAAAAAPLWPMWTRARADGRPGPRLGHVLVAFCGATALLCAAVVAIADPLGRLVGGDRIELGTLLPISAGAAVVMQAAAFPAAMALMDPVGIRFVAGSAAAAVPLNVGLSIVLAQHLGASGPLLATTAVGLAVQTLPTVVYARRRGRLELYAGRHRGAGEAADVADVGANNALLTANLPT